MHRKNKRTTLHGVLLSFGPNDPGVLLGLCEEEMLSFDVMGDSRFILYYLTKLYLIDIDALFAEP